MVAFSSIDLASRERRERRIAKAAKLRLEIARLARQAELMEKSDFESEISDSGMVDNPNGLSDSSSSSEEEVEGSGNRNPSNVSGDLAVLASNLGSESDGLLAAGDVLNAASVTPEPGPVAGEGLITENVLDAALVSTEHGSVAGEKLDGSKEKKKGRLGLSDDSLTLKGLFQEFKKQADLMAEMQAQLAKLSDPSGVEVLEDIGEREMGIQLDPKALDSVTETDLEEARGMANDQQIPLRYLHLANFGNFDLPASRVKWVSARVSKARGDTGKSKLTWPGWSSASLGKVEEAFKQIRSRMRLSDMTSRDLFLATLLFWRQIAEDSNKVRDERVDETIHYALRVGLKSFGAAETWYLERFFVSEMEDRLRRFTTLRRQKSQSLKEYMDTLRGSNLELPKARRVSTLELADKLYTAKVEDGPWSAQELTIFEKIPRLKADAVKKGKLFSNNHWFAVYEEAQRLATEKRGSSKVVETAPGDSHGSKRKKSKRRKLEKPSPEKRQRFCSRHGKGNHSTAFCKDLQREAGKPVGGFSKDGLTFTKRFTKPLSDKSRKLFLLSQEDLATEMASAQELEQNKV